jgi:hypothetical protein
MYISDLESCAMRVFGIDFELGSATRDLVFFWLGYFTMGYISI